jgi:hypothetical protein
VGETPRSVRQNWHANIFGVRWGDALQVSLEKPGYKRFEKTIPHSELDRRFWSGDCVQWQSEFGWGSTFSYAFALQNED